MKTVITKTFIAICSLLLIACSSEETPSESTNNETPIEVATPTYNDFYASVVNQISQAELTATLQTYENFGAKPTGSDELDQVQTWIETKYQNLGYSDIETQTFPAGTSSGTNIIVTKKGTKFPDTHIIVIGHYDAVVQGTNDNGTGTIILLELAKLLKDIPTDYSIKFIHFSGEEIGLVGSNYYVDNTVKPQNLDIRLVFNIDQVGGSKDKTENILLCERGTLNEGVINDTSMDFTQAIAEAAKLYSSVKTEIDIAFGSDYVPFERNGEIVTGLFEKDGTSSPYYHTENDLIVNIDPEFFTEVAKATVGAMLHFGGAEEQ